MAKGFAFRLEKVLKLRQRKEGEKKRVVENRLRAILHARQRTRALEEQVTYEIDLMRESVRKSKIGGMQIARHRHWLSHLNLQVLETQGETRTLRAKLSMERSELAAASKERRVLEKLKERQFARYRAEVAKQEQKESDELATMRFLYREQSSARGNEPTPR